MVSSASLLSLLSTVAMAQAQATAFSGLDLKKFDFAKLDVAKFAFPNGKEVVNSDDVPDLKKPISIALPPSIISSPDDKAKLLKLSSNAIKDSLPLVLKQFDTDDKDIAELTEEGATLFAEAVAAIFNEADLTDFDTTPSRLRPRGLFSRIKRWFRERAEDVKCGIFATGALPGYLVSAGLFAAKNPTSVDLTDQQKYFVAALHGNLYKDNLRVTYKAKRPIGFGNARGTAFGKRIYVTDSANDIGTKTGFKSTTKLLLHETTHSAQYKSVSWKLPRFGTKYLFQYCKAGFSYSKNKMEKEAVEKAGQLGKLIDDTTGLQFFQFWVAKNLKGALGFPKAKAYTQVDTSPKKIWELQFEKGVLQVRQDRCYRTLSNAQVTARAAAKCLAIGPPAQREACRKFKAAWKKIDEERTFTCGVVLQQVR